MCMWFNLDLYTYFISLIFEITVRKAYIAYYDTLYTPIHSLPMWKRLSPPSLTSGQHSCDVGELLQLLPLSVC